ncbi:unnamed protein product [Spodoptera exigua]|nr:unnamed protein product [Spodoptera exigua]
MYNLYKPSPLGFKGTRKKNSIIVKEIFIVTTLQVDHWNKTSRQTQARQAIDAERHAAQRAAETSQQSQARQIIYAERHADQRAAETSQHTQARQILDAEHQSSYIAAETSEETRRRRFINAVKETYVYDEYVGSIC